MTEFKLYPEGMRNFYNESILNLGETCVGIVLRYDKEQGCLFVDLGMGKIGIIPEKEVTIYKYTYPHGNESFIPYQISSIVGKQIKARVIGIASGIYILSRRETIREAYEQIASKAKENVYVRITAVYKYGLFCDIGNGVIGFVPISYCSRCRIEKIENYFSVGDIIKVNIAEIKTAEEDYRITLSRKDAYKPLSLDPVAPKVGDICTGIICLPVRTEDGYYVEITPGISGIVDISYEVPRIEEGTHASFYVKKITEKGLNLELTSLLTLKDSVNTR